MDLIDGIRTFIAVTKHGSFTDAAKHLGMSTALASKYVGQLEDRLETRLLNRTTRSIALTEAGSDYLPRAQQIVDELDSLHENVRNRTEEPRGHLVLSAPLTFGELYVADFMADFLTENPKISIDLRLTDRFVDLVEEGIDVAIRIGSLSDASYMARKIADVRILTCASPAYLKQHGGPRHPTDLDDHWGILDRNLRSTSPWMFASNKGSVHAKPKTRVAVNGASAALRFALADQGVGRFPSFVASEPIADGRLVPLLRKFEPEPLGLYTVFPHGRHMTAKVRALLDASVEWFSYAQWP